MPVWISEADTFTALKAALYVKPVLKAAGLSCPIILQVHASQTGLDAGLSQETNGKEHHVLFVSFKLLPWE